MPVGGLIMITYWSHARVVRSHKTRKVLGRCWGASPCNISRRAWRQCMLWSLDLLLNSCSNLGKSILDVHCHVDREYRASIHGFRHRLLPRAQ